MMNAKINTPRAVDRRSAAASWASAVTLFSLSLGLSLGLSLTLGTGCQNRAGMSCQGQSDCAPGLLCNKPPAAGPQGYGVCEPGLRGSGERCVSSAECSVGLICSTDIDQPSEDGWHGVCQVGTLPDAAAPDFSVTDLGTRD
jgi:hypothetical protein